MQRQRGGHVYLSNNSTLHLYALEKFQSNLQSLHFSALVSSLKREGNARKNLIRNISFLKILMMKASGNTPQFEKVVSISNA